jgi:enolase
MSSYRIEKLDAREILDSRGRPTVWARCVLRSGASGEASVPSGASTGTAEAHELRDGDPKRYAGLGCLQASSNVCRVVLPALADRSLSGQDELDAALCELDGTPNKSRLGANAILSVSLAFARAAACQSQLPLYQYFAMLAGDTRDRECRLPLPTINLFSGGKHAGQQSPLQDVLVVPVAASSVDRALAMVFAVYQSAAKLIQQRYGMRPLKADEGGLAPAFPTADAMLTDAVDAIDRAGLIPGDDVALAVDVAATHFFRNGLYYLDETPLDASSMIDQLRLWTARYPIISIEDGLSEDDWDNWPRLMQSLSGRAQVVGDDLLCTNPERIQRAITAAAADTLLLKVNQIGTLSEALSACQLARRAGWRVTVSARSGETEDNWLADLAVGWRGEHIKVGSIAQSDRLSKYNRLLEIERSEPSSRGHGSLLRDRV